MLDLLFLLMCFYPITEIECDPPYVPKNGAIQLRRATFGATVVFECDDGFELHGNQTLRCMQDGYWNGIEPKCKGMYCMMYED